MFTIRSLYHDIRRKYKNMFLVLHRRHILRQITGGDSLHLEGKITVICCKRFTVGRNVHIGKDAYINCRGGITIGDHTIISRGVTIYSYNHNFKKPDCLPFDDEIIEKPVYIGRYVWVGMNVSIAPGTKIGDGAILGMGSVVSGDIPKNAIVSSPKPQIIGYRDEKQAETLSIEGQFYESYWDK